MGDVCCLDKQPQENRILDLFKMVNSDSASNKYLHKKFKKVATLEDPSPPKKESSFIYSLPSEESDDVAPLRTTSSPPSNNDILHLGASQPPGTAANCGSGGGRYVCPYCKLSCAKPSVLRKHIRAHTNERPYPCLPCGFAFKTKSNLYKHCRSRAHTLKADGQSSDDDDTSQPSSIEIANKPYKPKFHLSELSDSALSNSPPFSSSPSPDLLNVHINKLITENHAIVEESEWTPAFKKHSPLSSPPLKNGDSKILELALTNYHSSEPEDLSSSSTAEPLNLTLREPRKRPISETFNLVTDVKEPPAKTKEKITLSRMVDEILHHCPHCKVVFGTVDNLNTHLYSCKPKTSPGPLLGRTPLVESFKDNIKKRRVDFNKVDNVKQTSVKLFGGEVHILDSPAEEGGFGRLLGSRKESFAESMSKKDGQVMTISKTGLHSVGGTMIQSESADPPTCSSYHEKMVLPLPHVAPPNLKVPGITTPIQFPQLRLSSAALSPLTSITAFNPLTLPPSTTLTPLKTTPVSQYNGGVVTILHDGKAIPFVPGMPGPNSLLSSPPPPPPLPLLASNQSRPLLDATVIVKAATKPDLPIKPMQSVSRTVESGPEFVNPEIKKPLTVPTTRLEVKERKFLRPSTLPLKPGTYTPKRPLTTPQHTTSLVSPETPRPRKSYGQLYLNGHAYTYLGLKCSTRMFFCTLNKPQPIYVPLSPDQYKVSMYSNWTICSDSSPTPPGMDTRRAMSCYDSRNRPSCFTVANKNKQDLITHSTYRSIVPDSENSNASDKASGEDDDPSTRKLKVCEGGYESNEDYTYIRGRGRGKFVCKECGIRCKKPSMLKKHIRTHTDLRPYTCKYCDFSFKTKGNLTKHMKSKAHYKRCVELDISPVPTSLENSPDDDESGKQDEWGAGTNEDESDEETEDDEDDEDEDSEEEGEECRMEREAARSLLSLSEVTLETAHRQYMCAGLVSHSSRPRSYPYALSPQGELPQSSEKLAKADSWRVDMLSLTKDCRDVVVNTTTLARPTTVDSPAPPDSVRPIDLSSKSSGGHTPVIKSIGDQALLLASICSTTEKLTTTPTTDYPEDSHLLHAYLTEKALRDSKIKLHQQAERKRLMQEIKTTEEEANKVAESSPVKDESETNDGIIPVVTCCSSNFRAPQDGVVSPGSPPPAMNKGKLKAEFMPPSSGPALSFISSTEDGKSMCGVCNKVFNKPSQLRLHVNIHYFERPYRCESCAVSFRTKGHLQKHQRSLSHLNKVNMNSTFGTATTSNPRPFKCDDCKIAFRIHGHLAKHFRSKMHIMKLECLGKLPFGTYAELERSGVNMNDIDTTDCENSLESLQILAQKLYEKDGSTVARLNSSSGAPPSLTATSADSGGGESEERITRLSESSSIGSDDDCPIMTTSSSSASEQISSDSGVGRERVDGLRETDDVGVR